MKFVWHVCVVSVWYTVKVGDVDVWCGYGICMYLCDMCMVEVVHGIYGVSLVCMGAVHVYIFGACVVWCLCVRVIYVFGVFLLHVLCVFSVT